MQTVLEFIKKYYVEDENVLKIAYSTDIDEEIEKLERKLDALIDMRAEGEITREEYNKKRAEYEGQIRAQNEKKNAQKDVPSQ